LIVTSRFDDKSATWLVSGVTPPFKRPSGASERSRISSSVPYKKASTFRRWITDPEIDSLLENCPGRVRDKLMYEFEKIATRIAFLKKKPA